MSVSSFCGHRARLGASEIEARIRRRDVGNIAVELPLRVEPAHLPVDLIHRARRGGDVEMPVVQAARNAVVDDDAGLVRHQHIARAAHGLLFIGPCVHPVDELRRIGTADIEAPQRRHVDEADAVAHGAHFLGNARAAFILRAIIGRTHPQTCDHHLRTKLEVTPMHGCVTHRLEGAARELSELLRHQRRAERRRADVLHGLAGCARHDANGVEVGVAALARPEAFGGIAFDQLNVVVAVLHGVDDVLGLQVFVEVDEVLAALGGKDRIGMRDRARERVFGFGKRAIRLAQRLRRRRLAGVASVLAHRRDRPDSVR